MIEFTRVFISPLSPRTTPVPTRSKHCARAVKGFCAESIKLHAPTGSMAAMRVHTLGSTRVHAPARSGPRLMAAMRRLPKPSGGSLRRGLGRAPKNQRWSRPISRVLSLDSHSSRRIVTDTLKQPTRERRGPRHAPLFGLAPSGVYPATRRCPRARCALTAPFHPYLIPCGPSAVCSLLHWSSARAAQALPGTLPCGARTFLEAPESTSRLSGRLHLRFYSGPVAAAWSAPCKSSLPASDKGHCNARFSSCARRRAAGTTQTLSFANASRQTKPERQLSGP